MRNITFSTNYVEDPKVFHKIVAYFKAFYKAVNLLGNLKRGHHTMLKV